MQVYQSDMKPDRQWNIGALAETVKDKRQVALRHCDAADLAVYSPDTKGPFSQDKAIDPGDDVPTGTTSKNPLILVAPDPASHPPGQGKQLSCSRSSWNDLVVGLLLNLF